MSSGGIWTPVQEGPHEAFVERLVRVFGEYAEAHDIRTPLVEVELLDGARFILERLDPSPGFGMVTLFVHPEDTDDLDALVVPIGTIRRFELRASPEHRRASFGFTLPSHE